MACVRSTLQNKGHVLIEVYKGRETFDSADVVRWCCNCGGVVVDKDTDGGTYPGAIRKMQFPALAADELERKNNDDRNRG